MDAPLSELLIEVAQEFEDSNRFEEAAQRVSKKMTFAQAKELTKYFHNCPPEPEALKSKTAKYGLLGVWMGICQDSIFEILYNYKQEAIPLLYSIGFGVYDWTQYKAIDALCRLAKEGIEKEKTIKKIDGEILKFRYEAVFPSLYSLSAIENSEEVPDIFFRVFDEYAPEDPIDGLTIVRLLAKNYPDKAKTKLPFIKSIAKGKGIENRSPLLDGAILSREEDGNEKFFMGGEEVEGNFEETHRITAALLYYRLDKRDAEINNLLAFWEKNAKEASHRNTIAEIIKSGN